MSTILDDLTPGDRYAFESRLHFAIARTLYCFDHPEEARNPDSMVYLGTTVHRAFMMDVVFHAKVTTMYYQVLGALKGDG